MPHPPNRFNTVHLVRGQTKRLLVTVKDGDGRPLALNQAEDIVMTVIDHDSNTVLTQRMTGGGIAIANATKGQFLITLSSADTEKLDATKYRYDLWVVYPGAPQVRDPVVRGADLIVTESVTSFS